VRADIVFGWRQLKKNNVTSAAPGDFVDISSPLTILAAALLAALPTVLRAVRIDPVKMLRSE